jgi:hypothetical protein
MTSLRANFTLTFDEYAQANRVQPPGLPKANRERFGAALLVLAARNTFEPHSFRSENFFRGF